MFAEETTPEDLLLAERWGLALRLGQRLSGGIGGPLEVARLSLDDGTVQLAIPDSDAALYGETVERRLKTLASAMGRTGALVVDDR